MQKTKYFNKKIYETETKIKTAFIILTTFLIGMYIGVAIDYLELQNKEEKINTLEVELDDKKEVITRLEKEKSNLETKLNNYTLEKRKNINGFR